MSNQQSVDGYFRFRSSWAGLVLLYGICIIATLFLTLDNSPGFSRKGAEHAMIFLISHGIFIPEHCRYLR